MKLNKIKKEHELFIEPALIESSALDQFISIMEHPRVIQGALLPDVHTGYTVPIGCVFISDGMIFPSAVGYDIGCSVHAVMSTFKKEDIVKNANKIHKRIHEVIPTGYNHHVHPHDYTDVFEIFYNQGTEDFKNIFEEKNGRHQLGTLGGGNHFIEVGFDEEDTIWITVHSGSRGIGHGVASFYMRQAHPKGTLGEGMYGFIDTSALGEAYINDMKMCQEFANLNRFIIARDVAEMIKDFDIEGDMILASEIDYSHNDVHKEGDFWVHRKGATKANKNLLGVIPGNMRDGVFIVKGKGNIKSLNSCSHGAGRVMSRKKAKEKFNIEEFTNEMKGIVADVTSSRLDESPFAYKDIYGVLEYQRDLIDIVHHIRPIINVKG